MALTPGTRLGVYEVTAQIGEGGMGQVYRARDTKLNRDVALKILPDAFANDPDRLARFTREAQTLASLNHPNIAAIYGIEESQDVRALVMELVEGEDLSAHIGRGPIPVTEALPIAKQIADALEAAHEQGIIHRDLKPANVKVKDDGTVKVLDFGLAKALDVKGAFGDASDSPTITSPATLQGVILGTAAYMSPEQARGKRVDRRADIWAFGCVLFEMLTAKRVFAGHDVTDTIASVVKVEPDLTAAPREVRRLLKKCLEKDSRKRLRDIGDAFDFLDDPTPAASSSGWRMPLVAMAGLVIAGAVLGAAALWVARPADVAPPVVTRFAETLDTAAISNTVAVSPDGRAFIYRTQERGEARMYSRRVDQLQATPIGDVMAADPFFSPDGQWVGYRFGQVLKRVSVDGGPPETIATMPFEVMAGAVWTDDDTILLGGQRAGLFRISAKGGPLTALTKPVGAVHVFPRWLPGRRAILYTERLDGGDSELMVLDLNSNHSRSILRGGHGHYLPTGHLVFTKDNSLWAVPFDLARLEARGTPRAVVPGLRQGFSHAISDSGTLVYLPDSAILKCSLVWVDRRGKEEAIPIETRAWSNPRISPDGKLLALPMRSEGIDVWIWDLAGRSLRQLTSDPTPNYLVAWFPDGKRVAYSRVAEGRSQVFAQAANGSGTPQVFVPGSDPRGEYPNAFSPDGSLLFTVGTTEIGLFRPAVGSGRTMLLDSVAVERNAAVSPDGRWLAFESNRTGRNEIYVRPFPNVQDGEWKVTRDGGIAPVWSRGGRELYYWRANGPAVSIHALPISATTTFGFGESKELFTGFYAQPSWDTNYDVATDGRFLMLKNVGAPPRDKVIVVQNWIEELKRLVPTK